MNTYLDTIFNAKTTDEVCNSLQKALDSLRANDYFKTIPDCYENINAENPAMVQEWFDKMRDDERAEEEGNLKEIYGLYQAALQKLREYGFHRK